MNLMSDTALMLAARAGTLENSTQHNTTQIESIEYFPYFFYPGYPGFSKTVRLLIEKGANVNSCNSKGQTALMEAAISGNSE